MLVKEINIFEDFVIGGETGRTILKPVVTVVISDNEESMNYAKQIWNFLLFDYSTVKYAKFLNPENNHTKSEHQKNYIISHRRIYSSKTGEELDGEINIVIQDEI